MKKYLLAALCFSISVINAASETDDNEFVKCQRRAGLRDAIAQSYFKYASVRGVDTSPRDIYSFFNDTFSRRTALQRDVLSIERENEIYDCTFFYRAAPTGMEAVILPFQHKATNRLQFPSLDINTRFFLPRCQKNVRDITINFLQALHGHFGTKLVCHFISTNSGVLAPTTAQERTWLGNLLIDDNACLDCGTHANYVRVEYDGDNQTATLFDPQDLTTTAWALKCIHQVYKRSYQGITLFEKPLSVRYVYRDDQDGNGHDCGYFSAIYLLYALEGRDIATLSRFEIYQGFKQWIEAPDGLISHQRCSAKDMARKDAECLRMVGQIKETVPNWPEVPPHKEDEVKQIITQIMQRSAHLAETAPLLQRTRFSRFTAIWRNCVDRVVLKVGD